VDDHENPIGRMLEGYRNAVFARDVEAFLALYDAEVRIFDAWGAWSYAGLDAWRGMVEGWFGSLGSERVQVEVERLQAEVAGDLAFASAFVTYRAVAADGRALHAMPNRLTWALRRRGGAWKVIHEHTSAPIDFDSGKAILQR
jgi:ketosteroid isomerase-like protein